MQDHSNAGTAAVPRRANTPPPGGNVHGLGLVDALRIDLRPAQLGWLVAEIDVLGYCLRDELTHLRADYDAVPEAGKKARCPRAVEAEQELDRRVYQLQTLAMIAQQIPISSQEAAAAVEDPWIHPREGATPEPTSTDDPVVVVGPAAIMTVLIRGATQRAAEALGAALGGRALDVDHHTDRDRGWRPRELPTVTPAIADRLREMAEAAHAFTETYLNVVAHQAYSFDPDYDAIRADELEIARTAAKAR